MPEDAVVKKERPYSHRFGVQVDAFGEWYSPVGFQWSNLSFCRGVCAGIKLSYPSPATRIVDLEDGSVKEERSGNGEVGVNGSAAQPDKIRGALE